MATAVAEIPDASHYDARYMGADWQRLASYRAQLIATLIDRPRSVLLIGKGDGLVADLLQKAGADVTTLDVAADLEPDIVASVEQIPVDGASFDTAVCCEVLEHLPFAQFNAALREIRRVTRNRLVLSVPDIRRFIGLRCNIGPRITAWQVSLPRIPAPAFPRGRLEHMGHHWEIGYRGTPFRAVRRAITDAGWHLERHQRVHDLPWHSFFHCVRNGASQVRPMNGTAHEEGV